MVSARADIEAVRTRIAVDVSSENRPIRNIAMARLVAGLDAARKGNRSAGVVTAVRPRAGLPFSPAQFSGWPGLAILPVGQ